MTRSHRQLRLSLVATAAAMALGASLPATAQTSPTQEQLLQRVDALARELEQVKAQLQQLKAAQANSQATQAPLQAQTAPQVQAPAQAPVAAMAPTAAPAEPSTVISSYGEISYSRPRNGSNAQADVSRFVIGMQHRFDDKTKMASELEVEHSVASADDAGEVEVEQLYVEHRLNDTFGLRGGLFLMPVGLLNTSHEPTAYYGVLRNFVETAIIPTTWREGGVQIFGEHDNGISWSAGITTGFDLTKWDASSAEGAESPLGSIHQELQLAKAHDPAVFGSIDWRGIPGLRLGASAFTGKASQATPGFAAPDARVTLWDVHAKWTPGTWDLSALYSRGTISGAGALNLSQVGASYPVPNAFDGWYVQAAKRWQINNDYALVPFARYERFNTARGYDGLPTALSPALPGTEGVSTVGLSFYLNPYVVLKADLQRFKINDDNNRVNLGLGYSF